MDAFEEPRTSSERIRIDDLHVFQSDDMDPGHARRYHRSRPDPGGIGPRRALHAKRRESIIDLDQGFFLMEGLVMVLPPASLKSHHRYETSELP